MHLRDFQHINEERCEEVFHPLHHWSASDWMTALVGEVGEAANFLKKRLRGEHISDKDIAKELADVQAYLTLLASSLGIDLEAEVIEKFNEVSRRRNARLFIGSHGGREYVGRVSSVTPNLRQEPT